jgi:hypothetical protein
MADEPEKKGASTVEEWLAQGNEIDRSVIVEQKAKYSDHVHKWEPRPGWHGRYRCTECKAFGWRRSAVTGGAVTKDADRIVEYLCCKPDCKGWAIGKESDQWKCQRHYSGKSRKPEKTPW